MKCRAHGGVLGRVSTSHKVESRLIFPSMNTAQQQVLDKVIELLSEHFDHAVVAVGCYDEDKQYSTTATYSGGVAPALGLCKLYETKWQKEHLWGPDEE